MVIKLIKVRNQLKIMKKLTYSILSFLLFAIVTIVSCKKSENTLENNESDNVTLMENVQVEEMVTDNFTEIIGISLLDMFLFEESGNQLITNSEVSEVLNTSNNLRIACKNVTVNPTGNVFPKTVTIDFGQGCDEGNRVRKGKMIVVYTGRMKEAGSKVTTTYENFYINEDKIEGSKTIVNNGPNANGKVSFTVTVNHTRTFAKGGSAKHNSVKTFTWMEGFATNIPLDDVFAITGAESGSDSNGKTFSTTTLKPLIKKVACPFMVAGRLQVNKSGRPSQVIDFGEGECDAKAVVTVNGVSKEISLKK